MQLIKPFVTKYCNAKEARWDFIEDHGNGWSITVTDDEPLCRVTARVDMAKARSKQLMVKSYSENEGVLRCLIDNDIIDPAKGIIPIPTGFVHVHLCGLHDDLLAQLEQEHAQYIKEWA